MDLHFCDQMKYWATYCKYKIVDNFNCQIISVASNICQCLSPYVAIKVSKVFLLAVLNVSSSPFQGAIDYKYHVEKLNYHGMLYLPLYSMFLVIDLPTERLFFVQALFQVSVLLTLNFKGISLLQLKNDDPAHADKVKNTFIFNTFVFCQVLRFSFCL